MLIPVQQVSREVLWQHCGARDEMTSKQNRLVVEVVRQAAVLPCHRSNCGTVCRCMSCAARDVLQAVEENLWKRSDRAQSGQCTGCGGRIGKGTDCEED